MSSHDLWYLRWHSRFFRYGPQPFSSFFTTTLLWRTQCFTTPKFYCSLNGSIPSYFWVSAFTVSSVWNGIFYLLYVEHSHALKPIDGRDQGWMVPLKTRKEGISRRRLCGTQELATQYPFHPSHPLSTQQLCLVGTDPISAPAEGPDWYEPVLCYRGRHSVHSISLDIVMGTWPEVVQSEAGLLLPQGRDEGRECSFFLPLAGWEQKEHSPKDFWKPTDYHGKNQSEEKANTRGQSCENLRGWSRKPEDTELPLKPFLKLTLLLDFSFTEPIKFLVCFELSIFDNLRLTKSYSVVESSIVPFT